MPSYEDVTSPIITDETGQDIKTVLNQIKGVIQPSNVYLDMEITLPSSGWSNSSPYQYTWNDSKVTTECGVEVSFLEGSENAITPYIEYEKVTGGVRFTAPSKPTSNIPVCVRILNASADSINNVTGSMVSTNVISGAANVNEALGALSDQIANDAWTSATVNGITYTYCTRANIVSLHIEGTPTVSTMEDILVKKADILNHFVLFPWNNTGDHAWVLINNDKMSLYGLDTSKTYAQTFTYFADV